MIKKIKSIYDAYLVRLSISLSTAKKKQLTMITTRINLSNQGLIATSYIILFLKGLVTERQHSETVA